MTRNHLDRLEQMERRVATIDRPRADEIALREQIIGASIRTALAYERVADAPLFHGVLRRGGVLVDKDTQRAEMRATAADMSRRVTEMFRELRPLVGLSGEAWIQYLQGVVSQAAVGYESQPL